MKVQEYIGVEISTFSISSISAWKLELFTSSTRRSPTRSSYSSWLWLTDDSTTERPMC